MASTTEMEPVHKVNLYMMKEIDRICRKYKIKYMLDAGTLLGAVRHKGFIPWDDDVDLAFIRPQYEAFLKVVKRELPENMRLLQPWDFHHGTNFFDFTARIYYVNSKIHEDSAETDFYEGKMNHLWIDLFVIDVLPQGKLQGEWTKLLHKVVYGLAMGHRYTLDYSKYSLFYKLFVGVTANIGHMLPMKWMFGFQRIIALKDRKKRSHLRYYSSYQPDYLYVTLQKDWCESTVDLPFEDTVLMAPAGWDEILHMVYGDYMRMPPEDKRKPTHATAKIQIFDDDTQSNHLI